MVERTTAKDTHGEPEQAEDAPQRELPRARLQKALLSGARAGWDRLGLVLAVSLTWSVLALAALSLASALPVQMAAAGVIMFLLLVLVLSAPTAGVFAVTFRAAAFDEVSYADVWQEARRLFGPATRLGLVLMGFPVACLLSAWFYARWGGVGVALSLLFLYGVLFWGMAAVYALPLLVAQESGLFDEPERPARRGALAALRRAAFLALANPFFTLGFLLSLAAIQLLMLTSIVLFFLIGLGTMAFLSTWVTRALLVQYGILPAPPPEEVVPDERFRIQFEEKK